MPPLILNRKVSEMHLDLRYFNKLTVSLASLGVVPVQKRRMPSSVNIRYAQWYELRYCWRASNDCIRVLMTLYTGARYH